jgi:hypothetical protein
MAELDYSEALATASGPLSFTYWLSPSVSVVTNVFGDARNQAGVTIYNGSMAVWMGSMIQTSPTAVVAQTLILGSMNIKAGTTFTLTIPTPNQLGNVMMQAELQTPPNPWQPFSAIIASWTLTS